MNSATKGPQCFGDGRVEELASAIAFQLTLLFPKDSSEAEESAIVHTIQEYIQSFVEQTSNKKDSLPFVTQEEWGYILPLSIEKWKSSSGAATKQGGAKKSFSLLDQLNAGGGWALPVTLEELQEIPTISERLTNLNTIQYMDDVLPDWTEIQSLLADGLHYDIMSSKRPLQEYGVANEDILKPTEESSPPGQNTIEVAEEYLKLHRKWFNLARSSAEYLGIQYGVCQNLSSRISTQWQAISASEIMPSSSMELHRSFLGSLLINWHDMFLDLMQRDQYIEVVAQDLEKNYFLWLIGDPKYSANATKSIQAVNVAGADTTSYQVTLFELGILPAHLLAQIDPQAQCFGNWVQLQSLQHLLSLLEDHPELVSVLLRRCRNPPSDEGQNNETSMSLLYCSSLAILRWIICKTRIALFPWHLAEFQGDQSTTGNDELVIDSTGPIAILDIFLKGVTEMASFKANCASTTGEDIAPANLATQIQSICLDAIETIVLGWVSGQVGDADRAAVISQCRSKLSVLENESISGLDLSGLQGLL